METAGVTVAGRDGAEADGIVERSGGRVEALIREGAREAERAERCAYCTERARRVSIAVETVLALRGACTCGARPDAETPGEAPPVAETRAPDTAAPETPTAETPTAVPARPKRRIVLTSTGAPRVSRGGKPVEEIMFGVFPW